MKPDSQDICFVPNGDYASVVRKIRPEAETGGEIVDEEGTVLGRHKGLIHYTVGQRRGLDIGGLAEPLYVIRLDPERQQVVVGPKAALAVTAARLSEPSWLGAVEDRPVLAKVRSLAKPVRARLKGDWLRRRRSTCSTSSVMGSTTPRPIADTSSSKTRMAANSDWIRPRCARSSVAAGFVWSA